MPNLMEVILLYKVKGLFPLAVEEYTCHCMVHGNGLNIARHISTICFMGYAVALLVEALRYKPEVRWFDSQ
jgi:hypothetical protein